MRRPQLLPMVVIGLGLILGACAGTASSPSETTDGEASTPAAQSSAPESQADGDGGGDGTEAPALADGPWTGGQAQITVSGGVDLTIDEQLTTDVSHTTDAKTQLAYNTDAEFVTIFINFIGVPFHASVDGNDFSAAGEDCEVTYDRADDTGIEATFSCVVDEFYWYSADEEPSGPFMIEGSFSATR